MFNKKRRVSKRMGKELKKAIKRLAGIVMAFVLIAATVAPAYAASTKKAFSLNAEEVTIVISKSFDFNIKNKVKGATYKWTITNEDVATVNEKNGVVTGVGKGITNVKCRITVDGKNYLLRAKVTVLKPAVKVDITNPVKGLEVGEYYRLKADIIPESSNDIITWSSSNEDIVRVDKDGSFAAKKEGTVTITASNESKRSDSVTIKIGDGVGTVDPEDSEDDAEDTEKEDVKVLETVYEEDFANSLGDFGPRGSASVIHSKSGKDADGGKGLLSITGRTSTWNGTIADIFDKVTPGASYQVTGWVRYTSGEDEEVIKVTQQANVRGEDKYLAISGDVTVKKGQWTELTGVMEVPAGASASFVYLEANSLIDFYVDNVKIQKIDAEIVEEDLSGIEAAKVGDIVYKNDFEGEKVLDARAGSVRTITTDVSRNGKASLQVTRENGWDGAGVRFATTNDIEILSLYGNTVHASFYVMYNDGPDQVEFKINNRMEKADNSDVVLAQQAVTKGEWTLLEADCYIAENATGNIIFIETNGDVALTFYVDDVEFEVVK